MLIIHIRFILPLIRLYHIAIKESYSRVRNHEAPTRVIAFTMNCGGIVCDIFVCADCRLISQRLSLASSPQTQSQTWTIECRRSSLSLPSKGSQRYPQLLLCVWVALKITPWQFHPALLWRSARLLSALRYQPQWKTKSRKFVMQIEIFRLWRPLF